MGIQLSVRSALAWELAHRIALRENLTLRDTVERALDAYEVRHEPAAEFYARLSERGGSTGDFDTVTIENRRRHDGLDL